MNKIYKMMLSLLSVGVLAFALVGCSGGSFKDEQVEARVMKKFGGADKYTDINIDTEFVESVVTELGIPIETYSYTVSAVAAKDFCNGSILFGRCTGQMVQKGAKLDDSGKIEMIVIKK